MAKSRIELSKYLADVWQLLSESERNLLASDVYKENFKNGDIIYLEDDEPKDLMCLLEGKVKIFKNGIGGRTQIIRMIRPVQYFGYRAYFAKEKYVTSASSVEKSTVCFIPMKTVEEIARKNGDFALFFVNLLSVDLGIADERVVSLTQKHIRGRLAESLIFLKESYGLEEDGATINIYLAREDLANLSNMTTSNAIRTLSIFTNERIIAMDGRKIKIIDEDRLRKISRIG
ncbi:MAG: Crp/Fnr family transcriptional regulator [Dysgonamonadaceae bacterium]|jgi:CRP-like cAMP-binding protein|nr:Crp/Fnr family transcriptional regulator [Dysgonamonadaceae bacterium]MDD3309001.1 Crp/Fnr family transcriptional regulator [Dysgonamonadaceae bacterium]MDD3900500.1 Crp/Fnr family transcriptional regulator [Dysgonamonadaceae bacterium]MDD4399152.1 Crp/Fnr family transcriptional regulator [Dysgonamonadaceae bacterium]MEA5081985.1 Crp/Fnr family transcriptional regulator [Dysgonamonadaceae bacterium]